GLANQDKRTTSHLQRVTHPFHQKAIAFVEPTHPYRARARNMREVPRLWHAVVAVAEDTLPEHRDLAGRHPQSTHVLEHRVTDQKDMISASIVSLFDGLGG